MQNRRRLAGETGWIFIVQRPRTSNGYKAKVFKRLIARKGLGRPSNQGLGHFRRSAGHSQQGVSDTIFDDDDHNDQSHMTPSQGAGDELISTIFDAVRCLPTNKQAAILLDTSLALIESGQCGVSRLFFSSFYLLSRADMGLRSKIFSKFISGRQGCRKRT